MITNGRALNKASGTSRRKGSVLIICVGVLAILMMFGATLALLARVEVRASLTSGNTTQGELAAQGLLTYSMWVLNVDKYGGDGIPYNYDKSGAAIALPALPYKIWDVGIDRRWVDEGFDWNGEEFAIGADPSTYALFNTALTIDFTDAVNCKVLNAGSDFLPCLSDGQTIEFCLSFFPIGGARCDVNCTGNLMQDTPPPATLGAESATLTSLHSYVDTKYVFPDGDGSGKDPFYSNLAAVLEKAGVANPTTVARRIITQRYGADGMPGGATVDEDGDGVTDNPEEALLGTKPGGVANADDRPFGPLCLNDLLFPSWPSGSRITLAPTVFDTVLEAQSAAPFLTTESGGTILVARSILDADAYANTVPAQLASLAFYGSGADAIAYVTPTRATATSINLGVRRGFNKFYDDGNTDTVKIARRIYELLKATSSTAGYLDGAFAEQTYAADKRKMLLRQVALNMAEMLDADPYVQKAQISQIDTSYPPGAGDPIYMWGVENGDTSITFNDVTGGSVTQATPYPVIVEVEAAVDTYVAPYLPAYSGNLKAGEYMYTPDVPDWVGTHGYAVNDVVKATAWGGFRRYYKCTTAGTSGAGEPAWPGTPSVGTTVADGTVVWTAMVDRDTGDTIPDEATGYGKYIKLYNPWNTDITLTGKFRIRIADAGTGWRCNGTKWFNDLTPRIGNSTDGAATDDGTNAAAAYKGIVFEAAKTIPAHGYFYIIDGDVAAPGDAFSARFGFTLPAVANYQVVPSLTWLNKSGQTLVLEQLKEGGTWGDWSTATVVDEIDIQEFNYGDSGETDADGLGTTNTRQLDDPRPCWVTNNHVVFGTAPFTELTPWHADTEARPTMTGATPYINVKWTGDTYTNGDGWIRTTDYATQNRSILNSFGPTWPWNNDGMASRFTMYPGFLFYAHAGIPWCHVNFGRDVDTTVTTQTDWVTLGDFWDYIIGTMRPGVSTAVAGAGSPYENRIDDDFDGATDSADTGRQNNDRGGPEIRTHGLINPNTVADDAGGTHHPPALYALLNDDYIAAYYEKLYGRAPGGLGGQLVRCRDAIVECIYNERETNGPFVSVSDFLNRVTRAFPADPTVPAGVFGAPRPDETTPFLKRRIVAHMANLVTVRTDVWGVVARLRLRDKGNNVVADKAFYAVIDRSFEPARVVLFKWIPEGMIPQ